MWNPISINQFVKIHLVNNPNENESVLRVRIEAALDAFKNGIKCKCGKDIWIVGSASAPFGCFSCITGKDHPQGDYEIDTVVDKRDKHGRRHIDEMDPRKIAGLFDDAGFEIRREIIKMQPLCLTCIKYNSDDWEEDVLCNLNRIGQSAGDIFECGGYQKG